jgi:outer membrane protein TolC
MQAILGRIGQALAEYYPKLSFSDIVGSQALAPGHLFEQQGFQPVSIVGLRWRLFDFGRVAAEVAEARASHPSGRVSSRFGLDRPIYWR